MASAGRSLVTKSASPPTATQRRPALALLVACELLEVGEAIAEFGDDGSEGVEFGSELGAVVEESVAGVDEVEDLFAG